MRQTFRRGHHGVHRGHVDDGPSPGGAHLPESGLGAQVGTPHVDGEDPVELGDRHLVGQMVGEHAGVVHEDVHGARIAVPGREGRGHGRLVGHVETLGDAGGAGAVGNPGGRGRGIVQPHVGQDHRRAGLGQAVGDGGAEAPGCAGDHGHAAVQVAQFGEGGMLSGHRQRASGEGVDRPGTAAVTRRSVRRPGGGAGVQVRGVAAGLLEALPDPVGPP